MLKKGDKVIIDDGSWSRSVVNGELVHEVKHWCDKQFVVIEIGCKFPVLDPMQSCYESWHRFNNTVIQAIDSGQVIFIEERFLQLAPPIHKVMIDVVQEGDFTGLCGHIIEISDELYKEIKRGSQS